MDAMRRTLSQRRGDPTRRHRGAQLAVWAAGAALVGLLACGSEPDAPERSEAVSAPFAWPDGPRPTVTLHVEGRGDVTVELYPELAPKTVDNFLKLASEGFYDGTQFHRVIADFMIQGGDPNSRDDDPKNDGQGGPGYTIPDELSEAPHLRGTLSMANNGRADSGGSQFFIVHRDSVHLDGRHSLFGRVVDGIEVIDAIAAIDTDVHGRWGLPHRPVEPVVIRSTTIDRAGSTANHSAPSEAAPQS
jgi:cyclophilin family peptidyl-prolyl cis-trans isomerase